MCLSDLALVSTLVAVRVVETETMANAKIGKMSLVSCIAGVTGRDLAL